jgi:hypothetical protein
MAHELSQRWSRLVRMVSTNMACMLACLTYAAVGRRKQVEPLGFWEGLGAVAVGGGGLVYWSHPDDRLATPFGPFSPRNWAHRPAWTATGKRGGCVQVHGQLQASVVVAYRCMVPCCCFPRHVSTTVLTMCGTATDAGIPGGRPSEQRAAAGRGQCGRGTHAAMHRTWLESTGGRPLGGETEASHAYLGPTGVVRRSSGCRRSRWAGDADGARLVG